MEIQRKRLAPRQQCEYLDIQWVCPIYEKWIVNYDLHNILFFEVIFQVFESLLPGINGECIFVRIDWLEDQLSFFLILFVFLRLLLKEILYLCLILRENPRFGKYLVIIREHLLHLLQTADEKLLCRYDLMYPRELVDFLIHFKHPVNLLVFDLILAPK